MPRDISTLLSRLELSAAFTRISSKILYNAGTSKRNFRGERPGPLDGPQETWQQLPGLVNIEKNDGTSACLMGKSTISTGPFSIAMVVHQRVDNRLIWWYLPKLFGEVMMFAPPRMVMSSQGLRNCDKACVIIRVAKLYCSIFPKQ